MKAFVSNSVAALLVVIALVSSTRAAVVLNGDFEADSVSDVPEGASATATNWTFGPSGGFAYGALYDPTGSVRFPGDPNYAGENNAAVVYNTNGFVQQLLGITLADNTKYTLTVDVGNDAAGGAFPTTTDGIGGDARARLLVNGATTAMPGFVSSTASVPTDGTFATWTITWQTYGSEPLAGSDLTIDLSKGTTGGNLWFDNVALTVAVPEPTSMCVFAGAIGALAMRRRAR